MTTQHPPQSWRKSSRSQNTNSCVEIGSLGNGSAAIRDTKDQAAGYVTATAVQPVAGIYRCGEDRPLQRLTFITPAAPPRPPQAGCVLSCAASDVLRPRNPAPSSSRLDRGYGQSALWRIRACVRGLRTSSRSSRVPGPAGRAANGRG